ncbi:MAG: MFS transporter, partial [Myxococcota bacterium]
FIAFGLGLVLVGANQTELSRHLGVQLAGSGMLAAALSLGLGVGVVAAGPLLDRYPARPLFVGSLLFTGFALLGISHEHGYARWLLQLAAVGLGMGAYETFINGLVSKRFRERAARPMAGIHAGASLGAILGPLAVDWIEVSQHWSDSFLWLGGFHLLLAALALAIPFPAGVTPNVDNKGPRLSAFAGLMPLAVMAVCYVGVEASLTLFALPYAEALGLGASQGRLGISGFWLGLLLGRVGVLAVTHAGERTVATGGLLAGLLLGVSVAASFHALTISMLCVGLSLGCVYPLLIALAGERNPGAEGSAAGLVAGAGALGGFAIPLLTGALGDGFGVQLAFGSIALGCALMGAVAWSDARRRRGT